MATSGCHDLGDAASCTKMDYDRPKIIIYDAQVKPRSTTH